MGPLTPIPVWAQAAAGWRVVFALTGGVGVLWAAVWYATYRGPRDARRTNAAEVELIRRVGQFALTSTLWFFLTWFPTYLVQARGIDAVRAGALASLPFLAAFVGVLCSGVLSDAMLRRGASLGAARKTPVVAGLLLSSAIVGANYVEAPALVVAFLAVAFFGNGLASITWSLVSAIAPERLLGLTGGVFNFVGNLSGITVPIVVGYLARSYGFAAGLTYVAALALVGALSYVVVVGPVERLPDPGATPRPA